MTDRETLFEYRMKEAEETLLDAEKMIESGLTPRSVMNRAYYAMFYATLALFLHSNVNPKTSKHAGVIAAPSKGAIRNRSKYLSSFVIPDLIRYPGI